MQRLNHLIILFFSCIFIAGMDGCAIMDSMQTTTIKMDSVYRPFKDYEMGSKYDYKLDIWSKMVINEYGYYKDNRKTGYFINVYIDHEGFPVSLRMESKGRKGCLSSNDMMNGLKYVFADINEKYDLSRMNKILIYTAGYGEESFEISKVYEDSIHALGIEKNNRENLEKQRELCENLFDESRMLVSIKEIVALYGKKVKDASVSGIDLFTLDDYLKGGEYYISVDNLPKEVIVVDYFCINLYDERVM